MPQALCIVYVTLIWSTREAEVLLMFAGQLACEAVNFALKRLIKEERPQRIHKTGKGYGMPSSHAQFVAFWAVAMSLFLLVRHVPRWTDHGFGRRRRGGQQQQQQQSQGTGTTNGTTTTTATQQRKTSTRTTTGASPPWGEDWVVVETYAHRPWTLAERALASVFVLAVAAAVAWSRIYLGYHTPKQVVVGAVAGAASAGVWFAATHVVRQSGLLHWALESPPARGFRLRDLVVTEDLAQAGWEKWERREDGGRVVEEEEEEGERDEVALKKKK